jgi:hypothetical protein
MTSMIVVTNNGPNPAIGVTVTDELSAGVSPNQRQPRDLPDGRPDRDVSAR